MPLQLLQKLEGQMVASSRKPNHLDEIREELHPFRAGLTRTSEHQHVFLQRYPGNTLHSGMELLDIRIGVYMLDIVGPPNMI